MQALLDNARLFYSCRGGNDAKLLLSIVFDSNEVRDEYFRFTTSRFMIRVAITRPMCHRIQESNLLDLKPNDTAHGL